MVGEVESLCDSMSYTGRGLSSWQVQLSQAGYGGEDRLKVVPGPPGWGAGRRANNSTLEYENLLPNLKQHYSQSRDYSKKNIKGQHDSYVY